MDLHTALSVSMLSVSRGKACAVFKELRQIDPDASPDRVLATMGVTAAGDRRTLSRAARLAADAALDSARTSGAEPIAWFDPRYPALLNFAADPPPVLWTRGRVAVLNQPTVAIVGSRVATPYALDVAARLAAGLAGRGVVVASGLARGADSAAHTGCLEGGGATTAVLGSGFDHIYPAEHRDLAEDIARTGVVVSELAPSAVPLREHFPLRNRIISGISLAVVVVEASEKSGSLITARCALEQGRDVMAVPGSVLTGRNRGSHSLLKDGAKVVESVDDILEEIGWRPGALTPGSDRKPFTEDALLAAMEPGEVYGLDRLVAATAIGPAKLLPRLMELELLGRVTSVGGGRFARTAG